jgi:hypothetical protein
MRPLRVLGCAAVAGLLLSSTAAAQRPAPKFGILAGVSLATLGGEDVEGEVASTTTFFGGGFAEIGLSRNLAFRPELLFSRKGAEDDTDVLEIKIDYIEIPLLLQLRVPPTSDSRWALSPHFYIGPAIALKVNCEASSGGIDADCDEIFDETKSIDFSGLAGAGLSFGQLQIGIRYVYGFTKPFEADGESIDAKNRVFSAYLGWSF